MGAVTSPAALTPGPWASVHSGWPVVAIIGLALAYVALHLPGLGQESFWTDELFSVSQANLELVAMLKLQAADNHPPLYATALWAWLSLTHDAGEATVRLPSLLAIAAGMAVLGLVTWRRVGVGPAAIVVTLIATSTLVTSFGAEARMHGLAFGLMCVATAAWLVLLERPAGSRRLLVVFAAAGGLASLAQYYALMVFVLEAGVLGTVLLRAGQRRELGLTIVATTLSVLPVLAWLAVTRRLLNASGTPPLTMAWADDVASMSASPFSDALFGLPVEAHRGVALVIGTGVAAALMLAAGLAIHRLGPADTRRRLGLGAAALLVAVVAATIGSVESLLFMPTLHYRSMMGILPVLYLALGLAFTAPFGRRAGIAGLTVAVLLAAVVVATPPRALYDKDDWRGAAGIIRDTRAAGLAADRIVLVAPWNQREWLVELNNAYARPAPVSDPPPQLAGLRWIAEAPELASVPADGPLLLVAFHFWRWDAHVAILGATRERFGPCLDQSVTGITILRCDGAGAARR